MTQAQIVKLTGLKPSEVSRILRGNRGVTWRQAVIMSKHFGHNPEWWVKADYKQIDRRIRSQL